jgi:hypothetical protein
VVVVIFLQHFVDHLWRSDQNRKKSFHFHAYPDIILSMRNT